MSEEIKLGGFAIGKELAAWIETNVPKGATILELGSGKGTGYLASKGFKMYSVEQSRNWLNKHKSTYIFAPIVNGWFQPNILQREMPKEYDLLLIDAPTGKHANRSHFMRHKDLFNLEVPIIVDDTQKDSNDVMARELAEHLGREAEFFTDFNKQFAAIL